MFVLLFLLTLAACKDKKDTTLTELKTPTEKVGYAFGSEVGRSLRITTLILMQMLSSKVFTMGWMTANSY